MLVKKMLQGLQEVQKFVIYQVQTKPQNFHDIRIVGKVTKKLVGELKLQNMISKAHKNNAKSKR